MFYDQQKTDDEVLAEKVFQIKEYLLLHYFPLAVAAAAHIKSQITIGKSGKATKKTERKRNGGNLRMHVEHSINRLQIVDITQSSTTITLLQNADQIVYTCAAFCYLLLFFRDEGTARINYK